ncbi:MAG: hypothetical protein IH943_06170 [Acidobacteria bacterium]|nr:hypothetical protein [Acidobacteriota bacterium]
MAHASDDQLQAQTGAVLVAAPGVGSVVVVDSVFVSTGTGATVSFHSGSTLLWRQYATGQPSGPRSQRRDWTVEDDRLVLRRSTESTDGPVVAVPPTGAGNLFKCDNNEPLRYSTTSGNVFVSVSYRIQPFGLG